MQNTIEKLKSIAKTDPVIKKIWIFGSRYKGNCRVDSDLDLAVEVEWIEGQKLGVCENSAALWFVALPRFEKQFREVCCWQLDIQQYAGEIDTPAIHSYLLDASEMIYEKTKNESFNIHSMLPVSDSHLQKEQTAETSLALRQSDPPDSPVAQGFE